MGILGVRFDVELFSIFLPKISVFVQKSIFTQSNSVRAVLEIFW